MTDKPSKTAGASAGYEHGPIPVDRVPPSEQEPGFLDDLKKRGEVLAVGADWTMESESLPPGVNWVVYPNGDLVRVRT